MTLNQALSAMGYRNLRGNDSKWAKPIGYQLLLVSTETFKWKNYFKDIKGEIILWESKKLTPAYDWLRQLKDFEAYTRLNINLSSEFELTPEEII